ncbi:hypothetical protein PAT3040_02656 [Paenibacillus agaridevorans]|uniref:Uncharacterized protein n=1 Tax=Paenibacillus agaridevorans TaxID=171404 RepID=A0A2R5ER06_9BACL|nr:hypothetical protein [Paenibacillus agaridevorans]GBG08089.1 hypothetical protein PAT3040_02656 [Paenibacillus agaridevorans]
MKSVIALLILSPILFYVWFQPSINRTIQYRDQVLQKQAYEMAHLAALEGRLTPQIREAILAKLESVYFNRQKVIISGPTTAVERGEVLTVTLRYPQGRTEIFDLFGRSSSRDYYYSIPIMSEYVEGQL